MSNKSEIEKANPFSLYDIKGKEKQRIECTRKIDRAITKFGDEMRRLGKLYYDLGVGDTESDELIVDEVYSEIHGGR